jgi:hypothetical protein
MNSWDTGQEDFTIRGLVFKLTCFACPEQYDVYIKASEVDYIRVGYVRLRWGALSVDYPECGGETLLWEDISNEGHGMFDNEIVRQKWLDKIAYLINVRIQSE